MKKTELSYDDVYELYINQNLSLKAVAEQLHTSTMVVCRFTKANGLTKDMVKVKEQAAQTNLKKYGTENPMQNEEVRRKAAQTYFAKTGYENPGKNPEVKEKIRQTNLERYGVECVCSAPEVIEKQRQTNLERYGYANPFESPEIQQKIRETYKAKTGYENSMQNPEVRAKTRQTNLERYGVEYGLASPEIRAKIEATNLARYGSKSPSTNPEVKQKVHETLMSRYGAPCYLTSEEGQKRREESMMERYGVKNYASTALSPQAREILGSRDNFEQYILSFPLERRTVHCLATELEISDTTIVRNLHTHDLWDLIYHFTSSGEQEVGAFLDSLGIEHQKTRQVIAPREIDFYCPDFNIGIEYNGVFWHQESNVGRYYHRNKMQAAAAKGVFLYQIFENEWLNPRSRRIIEAQLANLFHRNTETVYARKCELKEVPKEEKRLFLEENHLQGNDEAPVAYGLYHNSELVAIMTFKIPYFNHRYDWELSRFCPKLGTTVVGGASRLFQHFVRSHSGTIITYSNNAKTRGDLYATLGFTKQKDSAPGFFYSDGQVTLSRHQSRTEKGQALIKELYLCKVWDCGNKVWTYTIPEHKTATEE